MFRKHFRFKRFALGLAFAAMALPVAPAGAVGLSNSVNGPSQFYKQQQEQMSKAISDLSNSVNGPAQFYKQQQEQMSQAISDLRNSVKRPDPSLVPQTVLSTSSGFDWKDAGIGASTVLATALLLGIALIVTRRRHHTGLTSA
jgi:predicted PurR-regulated permease PerM